MIRSKDIELKEILNRIDSCETQLPDFQRGWTWDNDRIKGILASLSLGYPMGAIMQLKVENGSNPFSCRLFEGVEPKDTCATRLILDGQQRLTSIYCATRSVKPVVTYKAENKKKKCRYYYYIDINKALNSDCDRVDAIVAVPENKIVKSHLGKDVVLNLSISQYEYATEMYPLNIVFDYSSRDEWSDGYKAFYEQKDSYIKKYREFYKRVLSTIIEYRVPVISLEANTPKEAVCRVFENVNTGGVALTIFELVTAMYSANNFNLRDDWEKCRNEMTEKGTSNYNTDLLDYVDSKSFLAAVTLYSEYINNRTLSCNRKDILSLTCDDYIENRKAIVEGFKIAKKFILNLCIYKSVDLPYSTQIIPLSVICAILGKNKVFNPQIEKKIKQWFWCGVFGELYHSSNDTRYANDVEDIIKYVNNQVSDNRTIGDAFFSANRLCSLYTRQSAAYKGIMALLYADGCKDFISGKFMTPQIAMDENPDIHHIFPQKYCEEQNLPADRWKNIINKTPIIAATNRSIGGAAPSMYIDKIISGMGINSEKVRRNIESHKVNFNMLFRDDFNSYYIDRAKKLLDMVENAMGKKVPDRNSEETIQAYGISLE